MRSALLLLSVLSLLIVGGCVEKKYEEGRENQTKKADDMMQKAEE